MLFPIYIGRNYFAMTLLQEIQLALPDLIAIKILQQSPTNIYISATIINPIEFVTMDLVLDDDRIKIDKTMEADLLEVTCSL